MMSMTYWTLPLTNRQVFCLFVDIPTDVTCLRGGEVSVYLHYSLVVPFRLIGEHGNEAAPTCICYGLGKMMVSLHSLNVQVLNANCIISSDKSNRALMQIVGTTVSSLIVKSGNFESLVFKPSAAFLLSGKMLLRLCKFALVFPCISVIFKYFSIRSDKQVLQSHIHTDGLIRLFKRTNVFLFRKHGNEILSTWGFGNSNLAYFALYLTMDTALDALFELGYEKPVACDRGKLWYGETILRPFGLEVRELSSLLKEIGIGCFKATESELQCLGVYLVKPCGIFLLLQASENLGLRIVVVAFASKPILLLTLIEKVIIDIAGTSEMPCQQFGLSLVRVQPELICSVYLSHIAYKVNNYFVNYQIFLYICDMEKNYNHENRHKYYLKCHLIFCIKYRRKILYGDFGNYIKTNFKSIAGNSDFNIEIMETDKDHIHFLISYPPKLSVTSMVRRLKQESTILAWRAYHNLLRKYFWKEKTLWSDGYFVCSIGEACPNTVMEYIRKQG